MATKTIPEYVPEYEEGDVNTITSIAGTIHKIGGELIATDEHHAVIYGVAIEALALRISAIANRACRGIDHEPK